MKAYVLTAGATSLEHLRRVELPDPKPGPGQILVRMRAASLNYRDQLIVTGHYFGGSVTRNTIPLSDGAGEIAEIGSGVTRFKPGDRIVSTFFRGWVDGAPAGPPIALGNPVDGVLAEYVVFDQSDAVALPQTLSFEEGATLSCAGVTAWHAIARIGDVRPGQTVLVLGSGGVSVFGLQLAKAAGARVIMTSSSDEKLDRGRKLGADTGINYVRTPDWEQEVLKATGGRGVNCVVEVGGPGTLARSMRALGNGGRICLIGFLAGPQGDTNPHPLMLKGASLHGIFVGSRLMLEEVIAAIDANGIKPVIDRIFDFEAVRDAYDYQKSGAFGKVLIRI